MKSLSSAESSIGSLSDLVSALAVVGVELALVATAALALFLIATWVIRRIASLGVASDHSTRTLQSRARYLLLAATLMIAVAVLGYNGWLVFRHANVKDHTLMLLRAIGPGFWTGLA